jgi:hypothetical protein
MALRTRADRFGIGTHVSTTEIGRASRLVARSTGLRPPADKAIVGANAFAHEAGIHQDGMLTHRDPYEIMRADDVGLESGGLVLGKHSGRAAARSPSAAAEHAPHRGGCPGFGTRQRFRTRDTTPKRGLLRRRARTDRNAITRSVSSAQTRSARRTSTASH